MWRPLSTGQPLAHSRHPNLFPQSNLHHQEIQAKCVIPLSPPKQHLNPSSRSAGTCVRTLISVGLLTLQESNDKGLFKISDQELITRCDGLWESRLLLWDACAHGTGAFTYETVNCVFGQNPIQTVLLGLNLTLCMCLLRFYTTNPTDVWT